MSAWLLRFAIYMVAVALVLLSTPQVLAQDGDQEQDFEARLKSLERIIQRQQRQLDAQARLIEDLRGKQAKPASATAQGAPEAPVLPPLIAAEDAQTSAQANSKDVVSEGQAAAEAELARREAAGEDPDQVDSAQTLYDPSNTVFDPNFPRAFHLPGTTAAMRIGGFTNLSLISSFDPLLITDRFITGSIPPEGVTLEGARSGTDVTASQTRLNIEVREQTKHGPLRAFIEGDFFGEGDTFRLRHAFGQYYNLLAGKTWTTFMNVNALPEEVDIEGVNGALLRRQPQFRFFPSLGRDLSLRVAIEEPDTQVVNGTGNKGRWDLVASVDKLPLGRLGGWNYQLSFVLRELEGQFSSDPNGEPEADVPEGATTGWGITTSGRWNSPAWGEEDFLLWQVTYGRGVGRYINDFGTTGGGDAVFDPDGNLRALPAFAGLVSYRHRWEGLPRWLDHWPGLIRSNFTFSWVDVDNYDFQDEFDYKRTMRLSANLLYFPTQNLRLGAEFLWGIRENKGGSDGTASQLQLSARYNF